MKYLSYILIIAQGAFLTACSKEHELSKISMHPPLVGGGPWQVITYQEERVEREVVKFENGEVYSVAKAVYMDSNGRFVFKDGEPIQTISGDDIYWNSQGLLITSRGRLISKSRYFSINGVPAEDNEALMFRDPLLQAKAEIAQGEKGR